MNTLLKAVFVILLIGLGWGCGESETPAMQALSIESVPLTPWQAETAMQVEDARLLPLTYPRSSADRLLLSERDGLWLADANGDKVVHRPGSFERVDFRAVQDALRVATYDRDRQQVMLVSWKDGTAKWGEPVWLPTLDFGVEGLCLYQEVTNLMVFVLGEEGRGQQWLVASHGQWLAAPRLVRQIPVPPGAERCLVDDEQQRLLVNEPGVGVWQMPANAESEILRTPVAIREPFGKLQQDANDLSLFEQSVWVLDTEAARIQRYRLQTDSDNSLPSDDQGMSENGGSAWQFDTGWSLQDLPEKPEQFSFRRAGDQVLMLVLDESNGLWQGELTLSPLPVLDGAGLDVTELGGADATSVPFTVQPVVQTEPVQRRGDAADDPAIWIHPASPDQSLVLGTDKQQGLLVYDLGGQLVQSLLVGRLNNVDVRYGEQQDIAVASHRDRNSLSVFSIAHANGQVTWLGDIATSLQDIYGLCLYQPEPDRWYAFANDKDGTFVQYLIQIQMESGKSRVSGEVVRRFKVGSQPEGCVADDVRHRLYLGEEDTGVWTVDARADAEAELEPVLMVGDVLKADVEGLALYQADEPNLIVSSQGNDRYVVLQGQPPFNLLGVFRIGLNSELGIDGASETDGLEVTSASLGEAFNKGLLVVQDGRNRLPEANQNFKLVPWADVMSRMGSMAPVE